VSSDMRPPSPVEPADIEKWLDQRRKALVWGFEPVFLGMLSGVAISLASSILVDILLHDTVHDWFRTRSPVILGAILLNASAWMMIKVSVLADRMAKEPDLGAAEIVSRLLIESRVPHGDDAEIDRIQRQAKQVIETRLVEAHRIWIRRVSLTGIGAIVLIVSGVLLRGLLLRPKVDDAVSRGAMPSVSQVPGDQTPRSSTAPSGANYGLPTSVGSADRDHVMMQAVAGELRRIGKVDLNDQSKDIRQQYRSALITIASESRDPVTVPALIANARGSEAALAALLRLGPTSVQIVQELVESDADSDVVEGALFVLRRMLETNRSASLRDVAIRLASSRLRGNQAAPVVMLAAELAAATHDPSLDQRLTDIANGRFQRAGLKLTSGEPRAVQRRLKSLLNSK
jgi:hypothetical protein